jgi:hypothetical protein
MPRRVLVNIREMGQIELLLVRMEGGCWEPEWEALRETPIAGLLPVVTRQDIEHALKGYTRPLYRGLGLPPDGALRKLPKDAKECRERRSCRLWRPEECHPVAKAMPWCFQPDALPLKAAEVIQLWREKTYIVITLEEDQNA